MSHHDTQAHEHHGPGYATYWLIWLALVGFTGITIAIAGVDLKSMNLAYLVVPIAMAIATVKTTLVLLYFMHLKYESRLLQGMILVCLVTFAIFITLTFIDIGFRS